MREKKNAQIAEHLWKNFCEEKSFYYFGKVIFIIYLFYNFIVKKYLLFPFTMEISFELYTCFKKNDIDILINFINLNIVFILILTPLHLFLMCFGI